MQEQLQGGHPSVLAIVTISQGSSPGRQGFKLLITETSTLGTVGGGVMEAKIITQAREMIANHQTTPILRELLHHRNATDEKRSGLFCSGSQIVILVPLQKDDLKTINQFIASYDSSSKEYLEVSQDGLTLIYQSEQEISWDMKDETDFKYIERVGNPNTVYIFGAGHVGSAISQALTPLDFKIVLIDPRAQLPDLDRTYHELHTIPYSRSHEVVKTGERSYVLVVTSERVTDEKVLNSLQHGKFKFIGLMGSKTKIRFIFDKLKEQGVSESYINSIQAPIGIGIPNESPEEIGVSVVAQLISVRHARKH